jgi:hypothetical protein
MGRRHGELLREHGGYEETLDFYRRLPGILLGAERGGVPETILRPAVALALRHLDRDRPRPYRERTRAFFEALGYPRRFARHVFVMDLLQNVVGLAGRFGHGPSRRVLACAAVPACSSVAVWGRASREGELRHARNFDFPGAGVWERQPAVVFCRPDRGQRYGFVTTRGADTPGVTAFNESGLALSAHTRFHRHVRFSGAGIVDLGHDIIRRAETLADAERIVRERPVASTWGLLVSSAREKSARLLEITGRSVSTVRPGPGEDFLGQTNRYRSPNLVADEVAPMTGFVENSDGRARALRSGVEQAKALATSDLQALLGTGILAQPITVKSVVMEPGARTLHVSVGRCPTGEGPWVELPMEWSGPESRVVGDVPAETSSETGRAAYLRAVSLDGLGAPRSEIAACLERAVALDPGEPSYRLLAGAHALKSGDAARALEHFAAGLARERGPFPRAQLLLWASRAARAAGRGSEADAFADELARLEHPLVGEHRESSRRERARPLSRRALSRIMVNLVFPDVSLG